MILLYVALIVLFLIDVRPVFTGKHCNACYLSKDYCACVKGFFVVLVFFAHGGTYVRTSDGGGYHILLDNLYFTVTALLGQLVVVMFLFYSGDGVYEQTKAKGDLYIKTFLKNRFLPTYVSFAICVFFYFLLSLVIHKNYTFYQTALSFVGWESIGNSNWFMFVTFALYILFFVSFSITNKNEAGLIMFSVLSVLLVAVLFVAKESWWWNTLLCFTAGMWWSRFRERIEPVLFSSFTRWLISFVIAFAVFAGFYVFGRKISLLYVLTSLFFALAFCIATMRLDFRGGRIFGFLGQHVFSIYILQRLVFMSLSCFGIERMPCVYMSVCFVLTVCMACLYDVCFSQVRKRISIVLERYRG